MNAWQQHNIDSFTAILENKSGKISMACILICQFDNFVRILPVSSLKISPSLDTIAYFDIRALSSFFGLKIFFQPLPGRQDSMAFTPQNPAALLFSSKTAMGMIALSAFGNGVYCVGRRLHLSGIVVDSHAHAHGPTVPGADGLVGQTGAMIAASHCNSIFIV